MQFLGGYNFKNPSLLSTALTHISVAVARRNKTKSYERLEFLGDRVLGLVCAEMLLDAFPRENEGKIARRHASLVCGETIALVVKRLGIADHIELHKDTHLTDAILADVGESIIASLYKDGGLPAAQQFIRTHWQPLLEADLTAPKDIKSKLQEWAQARGLDLPVYEITEIAGTDHKPIFTVTASLLEHQAKGKGASKKLAERVAAKNLLQIIRDS